MKTRFLSLGLLVGVVVVLAAVSGSMAASIPGTIVAAKITTGNDANTFSIGDSNEMAGTPKSVGTSAQRDAITMARRVVGMSCWVQDEGAEYQLIGGIQNSNWVLRSTATYNFSTNFYFTYLTNMYIDNTVSNYYMTNLVYNNNISNYYTTNVAYYAYTTNVWFTNIVNQNTYISNFWETNWTVFPSYVSNYFVTNYYTTITNITTNITAINYSTNLFITNLYATYFTNWYSYITNLYATYITNEYLYTTNLYASYIYNEYSYITNLYATYLTNEYAYITNLYVNNLTVNNIYSLTNYFGDIYLTNGFFQLINTWPGPTNGMDCGIGYQEYTAWTPCAVTVFSNGVAGFVANSVLSITNASDSNITLYVTATLARSGDYVTSYTITNNDVLDLSVQRINNSWTKFLSRSFP